MSRVVLDEGVPRQLVGLLREKGCEVHAFDTRWDGVKNGRLLSLMEAAGFDVVVTSDGSMYHQQNFRHRRIVLVVLPTNNRFDLAPKIDLIVKGIEDAKRDRRHVFLDFPLRRRPR